MIFVTDKGRLANNMFQYGHVYAWGREHGRSTMSMRFAYKYPDFRISHSRYHNVFVYVVAKLAAKLHLLPVVDFTDGQTDAKMDYISSHKHILLKGWWIRFPDLFMKYRSEIAACFDFLPKVHEQVAKSMQPSSADTIKLGVHIRRGDYKTWCNGRFFFDDAQYIGLIQRVAHQLTGKQVDVYICTNDFQLDQERYRQELSPVRVFFPQGSPAEDLCLLSKCDYLIGPPSSYTLIASMYHDTPLYWMSGDLKQVTLRSFQRFEHQMRHFDECFFDPQPSNTK